MELPCGSGASLPPYSHGTDGGIDQPLRVEDRMMMDGWQQNLEPVPRRRRRPIMFPLTLSMGISGGTPLDGDHRLSVGVIDGVALSYLRFRPPGGGSVVISYGFPTRGVWTVDWASEGLRIPIESRISARDMYTAGFALLPG